MFFADGRQSVCKTCWETVATAAALVAKWDVWCRERLCGEMWGAMVRTVDLVKSRRKQNVCFADKTIDFGGFF